MLDAYCWPQSISPGDTVDLMVSADTSGCELQIVRVGADEQVVVTNSLATTVQPIPSDVGADGCGWSQATSITAPTDWRSGFYLVRLTADTGETAEAFFVLRPATPGRALLVLSTSTWAAYNDWGVPSFYTGGHVSSLQRPLPPGFLAKPSPERYRAAGFLDMARDERRAYFADHSYWSAAAGFANWEALFVRWAETNGVELDYATSIDLATDPTLLAPYDLYLSIGHDEYWTASMRDAVEDWADSGGAAVFLSGNTSFWQIRLEDDSRRIVAYKFDYEQDPVVGTTHEHTVSTMWSDPLCRRPENEMTGVSFTRGGYANMSNSPPGGGYQVHRPEHWVFDSTGLAAHDIVGADPAVVGYECDGCEFELIDGRPVATGGAGTPANFEILATAPAKLWETHELAAGLDDTYVGELNWVANRLGGADTKEQRDRFEAGHAVMGFYERGDGWVFTTGCTDWAYGLNDPTVSRITRNLIDRALIDET